MKRHARWIGLLLFLPVPFVLWCLLARPWGLPLSFGVGVAVMLTHRFYARPFALGNARHRCLWCGRSRAEGAVLLVEEGAPPATTWRVCCGAHDTRIRRFLGTTRRLRWPLRLAILGSLLVFVGGALADHWLELPVIDAALLGDVFRLTIALAVLPLSLFAPFFGPRDENPLRAPFPLHIQALIGTRWVVWLFRIVGVAWLVFATKGLIERIAS